MRVSYVTTSQTSYFAWFFYLFLAYYKVEDHKHAVGAHGSVLSDCDELSVTPIVQLRSRNLQEYAIINRQKRINLRKFASDINCTSVSFRLSVDC